MDGDQSGQSHDDEEVEEPMIDVEESNINSRVTDDDEGDVDIEHGSISDDGLRGVVEHGEQGDDQEPWVDVLGTSDTEEESEEESELLLEDSGLPGESSAALESDTSSSDSDLGGLLDKCPICLRTLGGKDIGTPDCCKHNFCRNCIVEWAQKIATCPIDRKVFKSILISNADDGSFKRIEEITPSVSSDPLEWEDLGADPTFCEVCGNCDREHSLLLCDGCDLGYHCECLDPPLHAVPLHDWFCPQCQAEGNQRNDVQPSTSAQTSRSVRVPRTGLSRRIRYQARMQDRPVTKGAKGSSSKVAASSSKKQYKKTKGFRQRKKRGRRRRRIRRNVSNVNRLVQLQRSTTRTRLQHQLGIINPRPGQVYVGVPTCRPRNHCSTAASSFNSMRNLRHQAGIVPLRITADDLADSVVVESSEDEGSGPLAMARPASIPRHLGEPLKRSSFKRGRREILPSDFSSGVNILGPILQNQFILHKDRNIQILRDGTLVPSIVTLVEAAPVNSLAQLLSSGNLDVDDSSGYESTPNVGQSESAPASIIPMIIAAGGSSSSSPERVAPSSQGVHPNNDPTPQSVNSFGDSAAGSNSEYSQTSTSASVSGMCDQQSNGDESGIANSINIESFKECLKDGPNSKQTDSSEEPSQDESKETCNNEKEKADLEQGINPGTEVTSNCSEDDYNIYSDIEDPAECNQSELRTRSSSCLETGPPAVCSSVQVENEMDKSYDPESDCEMVIDEDESESISHMKRSSRNSAESMASSHSQSFPVEQTSSVNLYGGPLSGLNSLPESPESIPLPDSPPPPNFLPDVLSVESRPTSDPNMPEEISNSVPKASEEKEEYDPSQPLSSSDDEESEEKPTSSNPIVPQPKEQPENVNITKSRPLSESSKTRRSNDPNLDLTTIPLPSEEYRRPVIQFSIPQRHRLIPISSLIKRQKGLSKKDGRSNDNLNFSSEITKAFGSSDQGTETSTTDSKETRSSAVSDIFGSDDEETPNPVEDPPPFRSVIQTNVTEFVPPVPLDVSSPEKWKRTWGNFAPESSGEPHTDSENNSEVTSKRSSEDDVSMDAVVQKAKEQLQLHLQTRREAQVAQTQPILEIISDDDDVIIEEQPVIPFAVKHTFKEPQDSSNGIVETCLEEGEILDSSLNDNSNKKRKKSKKSKKGKRNKKSSRDSRSHSLTPISPVRKDTNESVSVPPPEKEILTSGCEISWRKPSKLAKDRNYRDGKPKPEEKFFREREQRREPSPVINRKTNNGTHDKSSMSSGRSFTPERKKLGRGKRNDRSQRVSYSRSCTRSRSRSRGRRRCSPSRSNSRGKRRRPCYSSRERSGSSCSVGRSNYRRHNNRVSSSPRRIRRRSHSREKSPIKLQSPSPSSERGSKAKGKGRRNRRLGKRSSSRSRSPSASPKIRKKSRKDRSSTSRERKKAKKSKANKEKIVVEPVRASTPPLREPSKEKDREKKKKKKRREKSLSPAKAIFADGDSIVVSLNFGKGKEAGDSAGPVQGDNSSDPLTTGPQNSVEASDPGSGRDSNRKGVTPSRENKKGRLRKTILIDLESSPIREQNIGVSPTLIVLSDDDEEGKSARRSPGKKESEGNRGTGGTISSSIPCCDNEVSSPKSSSFVGVPADSTQISYHHSTCEPESSVNSGSSHHRLPAPVPSPSDRGRARNIEHDSPTRGDSIVSSSRDSLDIQPSGIGPSHDDAHSPLYSPGKQAAWNSPHDSPGSHQHRSPSTDEPGISESQRTVNPRPQMVNPPVPPLPTSLGNTRPAHPLMIGSIPGLFPTPTATTGMGTIFPNVLIPNPPLSSFRLNNLPPLPGAPSVNVTPSNVLQHVAKALYPLMSVRQHNPQVLQQSQSSLLRLPIPGTTTFNIVKNSGKMETRSGDSPCSPNSSDGDDLFEPPSEPQNSLRGDLKRGDKSHRNVPSKPGGSSSISKSKAHLFDSLFGPSGGKRPAKKHSPTKPVDKTSRGKQLSKSSTMRGNKGPQAKDTINKLTEGELRSTEDVPTSAVELRVKERFLKKLNRQERVVEEVKLCLKPYYCKKFINKDEYKEILRRAVPKICHNKSGDINPNKVKDLVEAYVQKVRRERKVKK